MRTIDDASALNAQGIDVAARIGWITRMARITSTTVDDTRLTSIAGRLGVSASHLSRVENGRRRDGILLSAYEDVLGLAQSTLRSPVDILCRTFPDHSPRDLAPGEPITDVTAFSELTEELLAGTPVTAGAWVRWARELSRPHNLALLLSLFTPLAAHARHHHPHHRDRQGQEPSHRCVGPRPAGRRRPHRRRRTRTRAHGPTRRRRHLGQHRRATDRHLQLI